MSHRRKLKDTKKITVNNEALQLSEVDKSFCEHTINDLNARLAHLRNHMAVLNKTNLELTTKLEADEAERLNSDAELRGAINAHGTHILELEERLTELIMAHDMDKKQMAEQIKDLEMKYFTMYDEMTMENKLLNSKLTSLEELRVQKDDLRANFEELKQTVKQEQMANQELLSKYEEKSAYEVKSFRMEMETKLQLILQDIAHCSETRYDDYTRSLLRENITLQKKLDCLEKSKLQMQEEFQKHVDKYKEMTVNYESLDKMKNQLIKSSENKIDVIKKLTDNYEHLKAKYIKVLRYSHCYGNLIKPSGYESLNANNSHFEQNFINPSGFERHNVGDSDNRQKALQQQIEELRLENKFLVSMQNHKEMQISQLSETISKIQKALEIAIEGRNPVPKEHSELKDDLLRNLINITSGPLKHLKGTCPENIIASIASNDLSSLTISLSPCASLSDILNRKVEEAPSKFRKSESSLSSASKSNFKATESGYNTDINNGGAKTTEHFYQQPKNYFAAEDIFLNLEVKSDMDESNILAEKTSSEETLYDKEESNSLMLSLESHNLTNVKSSMNLCNKLN